jgi:hypothetical protein
MTIELQIALTALSWTLTACLSLTTLITLAVIISKFWD